MFMIQHRVQPTRPAFPSTPKDEEIDATFTRCKTLDELFEGAGAELAPCKALLEAQALDASLAAELDAAQLEHVLAGEPLGHVMRVKQLLRGARVAVLPPTTGLMAFSRFCSAGTLRGDLHTTLLLWYEVCVVMASLLLTLSVSACLNPVQSCAFEGGAAEPSSSCSKLVWADSVFWLLATVMFMMGDLFCWFSLLLVIELTHEELPRWLARNYKLNWLGVQISVFAFFPLFGGLASRCMLLQQNELRGQLMAGAFVVAMMLVFLWWFSNASTVFGFDTNVRGVSGFMLGLIGGYWPSNQLGKLFPDKFLDKQ